MAFRAESTDLYSTNAHALIRTKSILAISPYLPRVLLKTASETGGVVSCCCQLFNCAMTNDVARRIISQLHGIDEGSRSRLTLTKQMLVLTTLAASSKGNLPAGCAPNCCPLADGVLAPP